MLKRCLTLVGLVYVLSLFNISDAAAKICFLPDGSCGTSKMTGFDPKPNVSGCQYKSRTEAEKGIGECEEAYSLDNNPCWYRRCDADNTTIFNDYASCQKILSQKKDKDKYECNSCGSCYKLVTQTTPPGDKNTCQETQASCQAKGQGFEANGTYDSNSTPCGICKVNESCPEGYYTIYQSQSDCLTGEAFSSNGTANGKVCGKCTYQCSDYTLASAKDSHCYSCSYCQYDTSKYKCTESVQSGYQLVNGVCSKKTDPDPEPDPITCPSGYSASVSCATDKGFTLFEHPNYDGCYQCQCRSQGQIDGKCTTCSAEGYTESVSSDMECELCPINKYQGKNCKCKATCPDGYSWNIPTIGSCGSSAGVANGGWSFDSKTVCGKTCGKCSKNSCPAGTSTSKSQVCVGGQSLTFSGKYSGDDACLSCEKISCPSGTYTTRDECQQHVTTQTCGTSERYTGACKKGSISGCWKPLGTMSSMAVIRCDNGTCSLGFCLASGVSTSGYYGNACVQDVQSGSHTWKGYSKSTGFSYTAHNGGISSCSVTKGRNTDCSRSTSYSSSCTERMKIGPNQWEQDDGNW